MAQKTIIAKEGDILVLLPQSISGEENKYLNDKEKAYSKIISYDRVLVVKNSGLGLALLKEITDHLDLSRVHPHILGRIVFDEEFQEEMNKAYSQHKGKYFTVEERETLSKVPGLAKTISERGRRNISTQPETASDSK